LLAAGKKAESLRDWAGLKTLSPIPTESDKRVLSGLETWSRATNGGVIAIGFLVGLGLLAALGLSVAGLALTLRTPGNTLIFSLSIAGLSCAGLSCLLYIIVFIMLLTGDGGLCAVLPFSIIDPFSGLVRAGWTNALATWIVSRIGFLLFFIPILEIGRLTTFTVYQWRVSALQRDRKARFKGFLMTILVPSVLFGGSLLLFLISMALPSQDKLEKVTKTEDLTGPWGDAVVLLFGGLIFGGILAWSALWSFSTRRSLKNSR
jgi:hypothetical protein